MNNPKSDSLRLALALDRTVRRLNIDIHRNMSAIGGPKTGPAAGMVLLAIADLEPCSIQDLCAEVGRDDGQVSRMLQSLESKGFVRREVWSKDARVVLVSMTELGSQHLQDMHSAMSKAVSNHIFNLSQKERKDLVLILEKFTRRRAF